MDNLDWIESEEAREVYRRGREHGWDDANYADAYGDHPETLEIRGHVPETLVSFYLSGHEEGERNYREGLYPDGTPVPA